MGLGVGPLLGSDLCRRPWCLWSPPPCLLAPPRVGTASWLCLAVSSPFPGLRPLPDSRGSAHGGIRGPALSSTPPGVTCGCGAPGDPRRWDWTPDPPECSLCGTRTFSVLNTALPLASSRVELCISCNCFPAIDVVFVLRGRGRDLRRGAVAVRAFPIPNYFLQTSC